MFAEFRYGGAVCVVPSVNQVELVLVYDVKCLAVIRLSTSPVRCKRAFICAWKCLVVLALAHVRLHHVEQYFVTYTDQLIPIP
jgi:hypothetical protein